MNILDLLQIDGIQPKHASNGEWHSPCPFCSGKDRFSCWPEKVNSSGRYGGGRFVCRGCQWSGDGIAYLMKRRGLSFTQAVKYLGIAPGIMPERITRQAWTPEPAKPLPLELWQDKSERLTLLCQQQLKLNSEAMTWLHAERGLTDETIKTARLGWSPVDIFQSREAWGLSPEVSQKTGKAKKLWLPAGLILPFCLDAVVLRIRIRRSEPPEKGSRYVVVSGSFMGPMVHWTDQQAVVVVESELDALLVHQECRDIVGVVSLGSAALKPDAILHDRLMAAKNILVSLDSDAAGMKAVAFWRRYPGFKRWPAIKGKDVCEQWKAGIPVRTWVQAGLT